MGGLMNDLFRQLSLIAAATQHMPLRNSLEAINPTTEIEGIHDAPPDLPVTSAH